MSKRERWNRLLESLAAEGKLEVDEAAATLEVSSATIRRDLDELAEQQMLVRTRGGAIPHGVSYELPLRYKSTQHAAEKQRIATATADLLADGDVVGLNGGTTTTEVARVLALRASGGQEGAGSAAAPLFTVVTNALNIASELAVRPQIKIVVTGGVARPQTYELIGPLTTGVLNEVVLDTVILGVNGVDRQLGFMTHHEEEAGFSRHFAERARRVIVVCDASKTGKRAFAKICALNAVDVLVTDTGVPADAVEWLEDAGIDVHVV